MKLKSILDRALQEGIIDQKTSDLFELIDFEDANGGPDAAEKEWEAYMDAEYNGICSHIDKVSKEPTNYKLIGELLGKSKHHRGGKT